MATAADIGADFSNYQGNAALGGGNFGIIDVDTRPLDQLAQYTFYYNRELWNQRQKETDAKVAELASLADIQLNSLWGKDREQMVTEYGSLINYAKEYARKMPKTEQERVQNEIDWQTKYGGFLNNYNSGKQRAISYQSNINQINQNLSNAKAQDIAVKQLNKRFNDTDITTPISGMPNYKIQQFNIPKHNTQKINSIVVAPNNNVDVERTIFNPQHNVGVADRSLLLAEQVYPRKGTAEYANLSENEKNQADLQEAFPSEGKGWIDAVEPLNKALSQYTINGVFKEKEFEEDNASNSVIMKPYFALKRLNEYSRQHYNEAINGEYDDVGLGLKVPLPPNVVANDFRAGFSDFAKGVTPTQLLVSGMFAEFGGDEVTKKVVNTGYQKALDLERMREGAANYRAGLDLIAKGFTQDKKGKWIPPTANSLTSGANGGIVPYWENYIAPQITKPNDIKGKPGFFGGTKQYPSNYTGDVKIDSDKLSGLSVALTGEVDRGGKAKSLADADVKVRYKNGIPVGVVIDDIFYDQNDINSKATRLQDKNVNTKFDAPIFNNLPQQQIIPQQQNTPPPLPRFNQ